MDEFKILPHTLVIEDRKKICITGITDVGSFDEENLIIITSLGDITVRGENLQVTSLSTETGELTAEGNIIAVSYSERKQQTGKFFSRVFG